MLIGIGHSCKKACCDHNFNIKTFNRLLDGLGKYLLNYYTQYFIANKKKEAYKYKNYNSIFIKSFVVKINKIDNFKKLFTVELPDIIAHTIITNFPKMPKLAFVRGIEIIHFCLYR